MARLGRRGRSEAGVAGDLELRPNSGSRLAHDGIAFCSPLANQILEQLPSSRTARHVALSTVVDLTTRVPADRQGEVEPVLDAYFSLGIERSSFVGQQTQGDTPAVADLADEVLRGQDRIGEELTAVLTQDEVNWLDADLG